MGSFSSTEQPSRGRASKRRGTLGEDALMVLGLLVTGGFALTIATLLLIELLVALPETLSFLLIVCIGAAGAMLARAIREKSMALPETQRGSVPILRRLRSN